MPYAVREPVQEMWVTQDIKEEAWLQYLPYARQCLYFSGAAGVLLAGRVFPTGTDIDIAPAFDGDSLLGEDPRKGVDIIVGGLRNAQGGACPACHQGR